MKAVVCTGYGPPSVLQFRDVEKPTPRQGELLVKVHASTVSAGVVWMRQGRVPDSRLLTLLLRLLFGFTKPRHPILGFEFSGIVQDVGKGVTRFGRGDEVYGTTTGLKNGAYAEYVCVPEKWKQGVIARKPEYLTFEAAAALPIGGMTALQLVKKAAVKPHQRILVYGASGSVGTYVTQLATYFGGHVTGVCSTKNLALIKSLGANEVIDYTQTDMAQYESKFDVVIDAVGKLAPSARKSLLKKSGRFVSVRSLTDERTAYLDTLEAIAKVGKLRPVIDRVYPIAQIVEANAYADLGHKKGNVVVNGFPYLCLVPPSPRY